MRLLSVVLMAVATWVAPFSVHAQTWPSKPLRMVIPFPAGTSTDVSGRRVAEALSRELGQPVVVDNRAGAGGNLGADAVAKAAPDGYTLLLGTTGNMAVNKTLFRNLPYDPVGDFTPLTIAWFSCNVLVVSADSPIRSVATLIADAQARPGAISYGSPGSGTAGHLAGEWFKAMTGTQLTHVPYKGGNQVIIDLMSGQIQVSFEAVGNAMAHLRSGKLRALGGTCKDRIAALPDLPTLTELGVADFDIRAWAMFAAPSKLPPAVAQRLSEALVKALSDPSVRDAINATGVQVATTSPSETADFLRNEVSRWAKIVKTAGAQAD